MKKILFSALFSIIILFSVFSQSVTNREPSFSGSSAQAAEWIRDHDREFRRIAGDVSKVIAYSGKTNAGGSGVTLRYYDYAYLAKKQIGTVLELTNNASGEMIFVVWTNEARGDDAVFYNDSDKRQLDVSVASRGRRYGMSNDTLKYVRTIVKELN